MNDPQSTIDDFTSRLTDLSLLTPLHTSRPRNLHNPISTTSKPTKSHTLQTLLQTIVTSISTNQLPLDPTLPILHTPHIIPLKHLRPKSHPTPLLSNLADSFVTISDHHQHNAHVETAASHATPTLHPTYDPFPEYFNAQKQHLRNVSHYNFSTFEITSTKTQQTPTQDFLDELFTLLEHEHKFRIRFGCDVRSLDTVALLSAHKPSRDTVVPIGERVFVHTRAAGNIRTRNRAIVEQIRERVCVDEIGSVKYRGFSRMVLCAWCTCLLFIGVIIGAVIWVLKGGMVITGLGIVQVMILLLVLFFGAGREFRECLKVLVGWRMWCRERDVLRDVNESGRNALIAGLWSGDSVDDVVKAFGFGHGVSLREWSYDPRFGVFVGERCAFAMRGRRWFRVVKHVSGKVCRYTLFHGGKQRAFVGVAAGAQIFDGGRKPEIVV